MESSSCSRWAKLEEGQVQCQAEEVEVEWFLEREEEELVLVVADGEILKSEDERFHASLSFQVKLSSRIVQAIDTIISLSITFKKSF